MQASRKEDEKRVKEFNQIPGPRSFPIIGTLYLYLPYFGQYTFSNLTENARKNYEMYGPLVKETIFPGAHIVWTFNPEDIEIVLKNSGRIPNRSSHKAILNYRNMKGNLYKNNGLLPTNGEEWHQVRSKFQSSISSPKSAGVYVNITNLVVNEFVERINDEHVGRCKENVVDFMDDLSRLYLQIIEIIAFDVKIDVFSKEELLPDSLSTKLITKSLDVNGIMFLLDVIPEFLHRDIFPPFKKFYDAMIFIERIAVEFVENKVKSLEKKIYFEDDKTPSLLETFLSDPALSVNDIYALSVDLLLAGIDTTAYTTSYALYNLAKNPDVQQKLYEEALLLLPDPSDYVTSDIIAKASYLKAFLKESLRVNPISLGIGRQTTQEFELGGYKIPKGVSITTCNQVSCSLPKYFKNPEKFLPERWLKESEHYQHVHPFLMIPFGHGSRMCVAKRLAEQNMHITIFKLVRNFEMIWAGEDMRSVTMTINVPAVPINLIFKSRVNTG